ncbi:uncharacterized protein LOC144859888 [Branchiostoma floridae x Branchiostoma japonicum]
MTRTRHRDSCCSPSYDSETMICNTQPCCSCEWGNWHVHAWSSCSQTCGEGRQTRTKYREHCCQPSHREDHCDDDGHKHEHGHSHTHGVQGPSTERLTLIILGVLTGVVISGVLVSDAEE